MPLIHTILTHARQVSVTPAQAPPAPVAKKVVRASPATAEMPESDRAVPVKTQLERHDYDSMTRGELLLNCKRLVSGSVYGYHGRGCVP